MTQQCIVLLVLYCTTGPAKSVEHNSYEVFVMPPVTAVANTICTPHIYVSCRTAAGSVFINIHISAFTRTTLIVVSRNTLETMQKRIYLSGSRDSALEFASICLGGDGW